MPPSPTRGLVSGYVVGSTDMRSAASKIPQPKPVREVLTILGKPLPSRRYHQIQPFFPVVLVPCFMPGLCAAAWSTWLAVAFGYFDQYAASPPATSGAAYEDPSTSIP